MYPPSMDIKIYILVGITDPKCFEIPRSETTGSVMALLIAVLLWGTGNSARA